MAKSISLKELVAEDISTPRRLSLAEEAAEKLRELILLEKLPPGLPINERDLTELLGISRTPVREAIRQLEIDGLVEYSETRRPRVADPSMETLSQWLMIQGALEGLAGEQACKLASDEELKKIARMQERMVAMAGTEDRLALFRLDMDFHKAIVAAAHNPPLSEIHERFNARLWRARFVAAQRRPSAMQMQKHQAIVDALLARDGEAATKALVSHLQNAVTTIEAARREAG